MQNGDLLSVNHMVTNGGEAFAHMTLILHGNPIRKVSLPHPPPPLSEDLENEKGIPVPQSPSEFTVSPQGGLSHQGCQAAPVHSYPSHNPLRHEIYSQSFFLRTTGVA